MNNGNLEYHQVNGTELEREDLDEMIQEIYEEY